MVHQTSRLTSNDDEPSARRERPVKGDEKGAIGARERSMMNSASFELVDASLEGSATDAGCDREGEPKTFTRE